MFRTPMKREWNNIQKDITTVLLLDLLISKCGKQVLVRHNVKLTRVTHSLVLIYLCIAASHLRFTHRA